VPVHPVERKLAAIFAADIAGYSRLMARDEVGTLGRLKACRAIIDELITSHRGRIFNTAGDSVVADFASAVDAVQCAVAVQAAITMENTGGTADEPVQFRIGVHVGDVMVDGENLLGDGVNIAARLESLAEPGTICVSAVARDQVGNRLPLAFDDLGDQQVKNIPQAIRVYRVQTEVPAAQPVAALPLPDKPSIAVLPFQNMSGDPEQEYFADGIVEEITTAIARFPWLFVIARNSSFTYKGKAVDVRQVARELGVRYVLEGSVRKGGHRVRITGQLIDTSTGAHLWADRFDGALDDIFDLPERVASSVAGVIEPRLRQSEIKRAVRKPTENLGAYDLYLRAVGAMYKDLLSPEAIEFARRALAVQPDYGPAAAVIAVIRLNQLIAGAALTDAEIAEALDFARYAIETSREDPDTLARGGFALAYLGGEHAAGMRAIERALALNPSCAYAWGRVAFVHCVTNRPDAAIAAAERAMRLSPLDPFDFVHEWALGFALMLAGRYEEAMGWTDRCLHDRPGYQSAIRGRVVLCGYLGRVEEAREWVKRLLDVNPAMTIASYTAFASRFTSAGTLAVWVEGFRRAGLPEA
jgi:TolB-like protein/tetratricopeptide (TPR) repeat protein